MSDLISRDVAIEEVETRLKSAYVWYDNAVLKDDYALSVKAEGTISALIECVLMLKGLPSAELEIIRCKDCKWFGGIGCAIRIVDDSDKPKEDDFCSFAERKQIGSKLEIVEKSMLVAYEPEEIKQKKQVKCR